MVLNFSQDYREKFKYSQLSYGAHAFGRVWNENRTKLRDEKELEIQSRGYDLGNCGTQYINGDLVAESSVLLHR